MSCDPRYKRTKKNGDPYTCKYCRAVVMLDPIYSRYVDDDGTPHKCDRIGKRAGLSDSSGGTSSPTSC